MANDILKTITIDDTTYDLPSGGGAEVSADGNTLVISNSSSGGGNSSAYHKYSTEEKVVGEWIDGKPIYEKTIPTGTVTLSSGTNIFSDDIQEQLNELNIKYMVNAKLVNIENYKSNEHITIWITPDDIWKFKPLDNWEASKWEMVIQYTKTTD